MNETKIADKDGYLKKMSLPMQDKLRVLSFFPDSPGKCLDVGCANGAITHAMAHVMSEWEFKGIDLNGEFISQAPEANNTDYETIYLRELLAREERYDAVTFLSVLHEFFTYGEGTSSVVKALSDAHELLKSGGRIIIRDMILPDYLKQSSLHVEDIRKNIKKSNFEDSFEDFENHWGEIKNLYQLNHYLLKYMYQDNWNRELTENYVGMSKDEYEQLFSLLGLTIVYEHSYLIDYLKNKWIEDFNLEEKLVLPFVSTTLLVVEK